MLWRNNGDIGMSWNRDAWSHDEWGWMEIQVFLGILSIWASHGGISTFARSEPHPDVDETWPHCLTRKRNLFLPCIWTNVSYWQALWALANTFRLLNLPRQIFGLSFQPGSSIFLHRDFLRSIHPHLRPNQPKGDVIKLFPLAMMLQLKR